MSSFSSLRRAFLRVASTQAESRGGGSIPLSGTASGVFCSSLKGKSLNGAIMLQTFQNRGPAILTNSSAHINETKEKTRMGGEGKMPTSPVKTVTSIMKAPQMFTNSSQSYPTDLSQIFY